MRLSYEQVRAMNDIQINILKEFIRLCEKLNLKYFLIHGSLLGAYTRGSFCPYDDDIDIAMPREDYDSLMEKGPDLITDGYFIQSCQTEQEFPLAFGKIRDSNTTFIQTSLKDLNVNMGIYIDIFPIDFYPAHRLSELMIRVREIVLSTRISVRIHYDEEQPLWKKVCRAVSFIFSPSWKKAVEKRAVLFTAIKPTKRIIIVGAKPSERGIPQEWFSDTIEIPFEGVLVNCPKCSDQYLTHIYGDYKSYNPVQKYLNDDGSLTVSAYLFDLEKSYKEYRND